MRWSGPRGPGGENGADETGDSAGAIQAAGDLALTPGMPVEAHIRTSERSVMSYLVKPVTDCFYRSLRED